MCGYCEKVKHIQVSGGGRYATGPHSNEPAVNSPTADSQTGRAPKRSTAHPVTGIAAVKASR